MKRIILLMTIIIGFSITLTLSNNSVTATHNDYAFHDAIEITSDAELELIAASEGWGGIGTEEDPYVIKENIFEHPITNIDSYPGVIGMIEEQIVRGNKITHFTQFDLIISNIQSHVLIENNEFQYSVMILESQNVEFKSNEWSNPTYFGNLLVVNSSMSISDNSFFGNNMNCQDVVGTHFTQYPRPRVSINGKGDYFIQGNHFAQDEGCIPISNLAIVDKESVEFVDTVNITENIFESSVMDIYTQRPGARIFRNSFHTTYFPISDHGDPASSTDITENNFFLVNASDRQEYMFVGEYYNMATEENPNPGPFDHGLNEGTYLSRNHYNTWTNPDEDRDGIVDDPYYLGTPGYLRFDRFPQVKPYPIGPSDQDNSNDMDIKLVALIAGLSVAGAVGLKHQAISNLFRGRPIYNGHLSTGTEKVVKDIFKSQTVLYYFLLGQSRFEDDELEENLKEAIPKDFLSYRFLLHPIRLSVMKLLYENLEFTSIQMRNILEITWNEYHSHVGKLVKNGYVSVSEEFVDGIKRQVLRMEPDGAEEYKIITELMHMFLDNSTNYKAYIDVAQQRLESADRDLYPNK